MPEPRLYLIRHAESEGNTGGILQGAGEYPLSETGRAQALNATHELLALNPALVVASDLGRAIDTAVLAAGTETWRGYIDGHGVMTAIPLTNEDVKDF